MDKKPAELREILDDLKQIKEAVGKSDGILRFIDARGVFRGVLLAFGLLVAAFSVVFYLVLERYGTMAAVPVNLKVILFGSMALAWVVVGYAKVRSFLRNSRRISGGDMSFFEMAEGIYTPRVAALLMPSLVTMLLVVIFLVGRGHGAYVVPALAVLFGLYTISLTGIFFGDLYPLGVWLTATGLLTLFLAESIHPLAALGITFAAGSILASLLLHLGSSSEKGRW